MPTLGTTEQRSYNALLARERLYEREVARALRDALDSMRTEMTRIYDRHARDGVLSLADMTRYNRLQSLEKDILATMDAATRANVATIRRLKPEQYGEAFFRYGWAVDQATGVSLNWGQLNRQAIVESLDNRMYQIAVAQYRSDARAQILRAVNSGLVQGKSYDAMSRDLRDAINTDMWKAQRIIRTEGHTAIEAAHDAVYTRASEQGVDIRVVWDATLDGDTRPTHQDMDGEARGEDGLFDGPGGEQAPYPGWGGLSAEERINCRCRLRGEVEDYSPSIRRERNAGIQPYRTYEEWDKARGKGIWR